jgi:hypothetical protein
MILEGKSDFLVPNRNTSTSKKSKINMGIKLYNKLSLELRKSERQRDSTMHSKTAIHQLK